MIKIIAFGIRCVFAVIGLLLGLFGTYLVFAAASADGGWSMGLSAVIFLVGGWVLGATIFTIGWRAANLIIAKSEAASKPAQKAGAHWRRWRSD
jgi:hypothetical protein